MLLFVAPLARHETLWVKIKRQFQEASDLKLGPRRNIGKMWVADVIDSEKCIALMSWEALLVSLQHAVPSAAGDLEQVRGLAAEQDRAAFTPLHAEELVASVPRRIMSFCDLVDDVVNRGKRDDWLTTKGVKTTHQRNRYIRYAGFLGVDGIRLIEIAVCVDMHQWARSGASPIWLRIWHKQPISLDELNRQLDAEDWLPRRREPDWLWIPIELPTGLEYEDVLDEATRQVKRVRDIVLP